MLICPACGGSHVHHSRFRGWRERARSLITRQAPYRCHDCQWRGWRRDEGPQPSGPALRDVRPDLTEDQLDEMDPGTTADRPR